MLADWSVECAADDPVLVVPWSDPTNAASRFIDLRESPYDLDFIAEAEQHAPLLHALRALNATRSPVFTAKCDAWLLDAGLQASDGGDDDVVQQLEDLRFSLGHIVEETPSGFASYIDLLWRDRSVFASFHRHEQLLDRLSRRVAPLDHPYAMLDLVLRPAMVDLTAPQEGFAVSLYIKALGHDAESAEENWGSALRDVVGLLRGRAFVLP